MPKIMKELRTIFRYKLTNDGTSFFSVVGQKTLTGSYIIITRTMDKNLILPINLKEGLSV